MSKDYKGKGGRWERKEKQKEGMSFLGLVISVSAEGALVTKSPKVFSVESQLFTKGLFSLLSI